MTPCRIIEVNMYADVRIRSLGTVYTNFLKIAKFISDVRLRACTGGV
jgi:hypothetical protein